MINPTKLLKIKQDKDGFVERHADFVRFLSTNFGGEIQEGDELMVTYVHEGGATDSSSARFSPEDIEFIQTIAQIF